MKSMKREKLMVLALMFGLVSPAAHALEIPGIKFTWSNPEVEKVSAPASAPSVAPADPVKISEESIPPADVYRKSGMFEAELNEVVRDLEINKDGDVISFAGLIPKRCAADAGVDYVYDTVAKAHAITIRLPACDKLTSRKDGEELISLSGLLGKKKLKDESGKVVLRTYKAGDAASKNRVQDEPLKDGAKLVTHMGSAEIEAERLAAAKRDEAKTKLQKLEDLERKIDKFCKAEDIDALNAELLAAADLLGNVSGFIESTSKAKLEKFKRELGKADSVEKADAALEAYKAAALEVGEDEDGLKAAYIAKRFEFMENAVSAYSSGEKSAKEADDDIKTWAGDLNTLDSSEYRKRKAEFGQAYSKVGTSAANAEKYDEAISMYGKGKKYVSGKSNAALDGQISKIYLEQFMACSKKDPSKTIECEAKYVAKSKASADAAKKTLSGLKGDEAGKEFNEFMAEYAGVFGGGTESTVASFGTLHQQPGSIEKYKYQLMQEMAQKQATALQQQQMAAMQQQMGGQMGGVAAANPAAGAGLLGMGIR
ncbi:MAG: hypothetical protein EOP11_04350 [Proteobacteria bacterium]|nr:MAG: hypothetical protein EOP11_04350 [Pseudomonadota bacterium]